MARDETAIVQLQVRLREDLRRHLEESARAHGVSLNSEIVGRLEHTRDRLSLAMEVLALAFGREVAGILVLLGAVMHAEGLTRAGIDWSDDVDAYGAAVDYAMAALAALRPGAAPPKHLDEMMWAHVVGMVDKLAGTNLPDRASKLINELKRQRQDVPRRRPR